MRTCMESRKRHAATRVSSAQARNRRPLAGDFGEGRGRARGGGVAIGLWAWGYLRGSWMMLQQLEHTGL